jgi:molybdate transport system substrate-binding protein
MNTMRLRAYGHVLKVDGNQGRTDMTIQWSTAAQAGFVAAAMAIGLNVTHAADIKVLAANPAKGPFSELIPAFEKASGHKVVMVWGGTEAITKKISDGEVVDIVIIAAPNIDKLTAEGKLVAGGRADFAKSGVGIAVRSGLPKPDVSSADAVKRAVLAAQSVAYSTGPSGFYLVELFKKMGISEQIKDKVKQPASGVQVGELLARGEADLGFQQVSELVHVKGIDYLGPLPAEIQNITVYSAGLHTAAPAPDAAKALMKFLTAPEAAAAIKKTGMEPG